MSRQIQTPPLFNKPPEPLIAPPAIQPPEPDDPIGLQEGLIGGGSMLALIAMYFKDAIILFFRRKGPE